MKIPKYLKIFIFIFLAVILFTVSAGSLFLIEKNYFLIGKTSYFLYENTKKLFSFLDKGEIVDTIVYCDYYTWWNEKNWQRGHSNEPILGFYDSLDPEVIEKHSSWADEYGIDVFKIEYIPDLDESILKGIASHDLKSTKFCLMYDMMLRFKGKFGGPPYDFNNKDMYALFVKDMNHIADNYFNNPNYFLIESRPVLWIYVTRDVTGNFESAINEIRDDYKDKGHDVYLVGDQVFWNYNFEGIDLFDAISIYHGYAGYPQNTSDFSDRLKLLYLVWKIAAYMNSVDFIPGAIFEYDDTCLAEERDCIPVLYGDVEDYRYMLETVSVYLDPVNIDKDLNQVTLATFNENQEGSSIEPSIEWGFKRIQLVPEFFGSN